MPSNVPVGIAGEQDIGAILDNRIRYCLRHGLPDSHVVNKGVITHTRWFDPAFHAEFDRQFEQEMRWKKGEV